MPRPYDRHPGRGRVRHYLGSRSLFAAHRMRLGGVMTAQNRLITLNNGVQMPILGFGVFQIPDDQTERVLTDALAAGYRSIDTAASYGNEDAVGHAIAKG